MYKNVHTHTHTHTHTHIHTRLLAIKSNVILPFAAIWMDLEIYHTKYVRNRQISCDIIDMWNLM